MTEDQKHIWEREKRAVRQLRDGLGKPVDRRVVDVVAALRLTGIHTDASCGGHVDRVISPYVTFRSVTNADDRQHIEKATDQTTRLRRKRRAIQRNAAELGRLLRYLEHFYADRDVPLRQRLICQGFGLIGYRLSTQDADLVTMATKVERRKLVERQRQEFDAFTEFLKAEFFCTKDDAPSRAA
ncbi:hypothetical protein ACWDR3_23145 [Streptomyces sp. NPDC001002]